MKQPRDSHGRFASTGDSLKAKYDACQNILMGASSENARMRSRIGGLQCHIAHLERRTNRMLLMVSFALAASLIAFVSVLQ